MTREQIDSALRRQALYLEKNNLSLDDYFGGLKIASLSSSPRDPRLSCMFKDEEELQEEKETSPWAPPQESFESPVKKKPEISQKERESLLKGEKKKEPTAFGNVKNSGKSIELKKPKEKEGAQGTSRQPETLNGTTNPQNEGETWLLEGIGAVSSSLMLEYLRENFKRNPGELNCFLEKVFRSESLREAKQPKPEPFGLSLLKEEKENFWKLPLASQSLNFGKCIRPKEAKPSISQSNENFKKILNGRFTPNHEGQTIKKSPLSYYLGQEGARKGMKENTNKSNHELSYFQGFKTPLSTSRHSNEKMD